MEREELEARPYFKDDSFTIQCTINILKEFRLDVIGNGTALSTTATDHINIVPPLNLQKHLVSLLESGLGADVSFQVGTKTFNAH
jgi:speckle-type POZ protein